MEQNIYELGDTIIKIGLGAFIAGLFSFLGIVLNYRNEANKKKQTRRNDTIDDIKNKAFNYIFNVKRLLEIFISNSFKKEFNEILKDVDIRKEAEEQIIKLRKIEQDTFSAIYHLKLLQLNEIARDLTDILQLEKTYSNRFLKGEMDEPDNRILKNAMSFSQTIEEFLSKLSTHLYV